MVNMDLTDPTNGPTLLVPTHGESTMNIYRISQNVNNDYDTYDSAIVCANTEDEARWIHPSGDKWDGKRGHYGSWCDVEDVCVELIGTSCDNSHGVILASFNAG